MAAPVTTVKFPGVNKLLHAVEIVAGGLFRC